MKHVVIIGGGFAGVRLARKLKHQKDVQITIINSSPDFRYYPAMYRAVTGFRLATARLPLEWMLIDVPRVQLVVDAATHIDPQTKVITTETGQKIPYDFAVFALGSVTSYFNIDGIHEHAYGMKSPEEIIRLRQHLHDKVTSNEEADVNYIVIGAGPTGVEVAGSLGAYVRSIAKKHRVKKHPVKVWLVEAAPRILPQISEKAAKSVSKRLRKHGVTILTQTTVTKETINTLNTSNGPIKSHTVIWTAGTANNPFFANQPEVFQLNKRGRVEVNQHLSVDESIYVIGDNAATPKGGLAITAIRHANFVAKDLKARMHHKKRPVKFEGEPIVVIPVDGKWAVTQYKKFSAHGRIVSLVRLAADYIGYSDVLGYLKAFVIWSNGERADDSCAICNKSH